MKKKIDINKSELTFYPFSVAFKLFDKKPVFLRSEA